MDEGCESTFRPPRNHTTRPQVSIEALVVIPTLATCRHLATETATLLLLLLLATTTATTTLATLTVAEDATVVTPTVDRHLLLVTTTLLLATRPTGTRHARSATGAKIVTGLEVLTLRPPRGVVRLALVVDLLALVDPYERTTTEIDPHPKKGGGRDTDLSL